MARVVRLLTLVDLIDEHDRGPEARRLDASARLEAVLDWDHEPTLEERDDAEASVAAHWGAPADVLRQVGVQADAAELQALPQDVELSDRVQARIGRAA